jgi:hypothetical protein
MSSENMSCKIRWVDPLTFLDLIVKVFCHLRTYDKSGVGKYILVQSIPYYVFWWHGVLSNIKMIVKAIGSVLQN